MCTPLYPTVIKQNWGMQGYTYFFFLILFLLAEAVLMVPTIYVLSKNKKNYQTCSSSENFQFLQLLKICILHGRFFVMEVSETDPIK